CCARCRVSHLRLVTDVPRPSAGRRGCPSPALSLTKEEAQHTSAGRSVARQDAVRQPRRARAGVGIHRAVLTRTRQPSASLAVAVWRLTGIPLDVLLRGGLSVVPASLAAALPERDPA